MLSFAPAALRSSEQLLSISVWALDKVLLEHL